MDRLNRIVVDFLFAVKPMDTMLEDGDINHVIEELIEFVRPELDQAGVVIDAELSPASRCCASTPATSSRPC